MARSDNAATIAAVAAKCKTVGAARAALGNVSRLLGGAYAITDEASLWDESELKDAIRGRLDTVNRGAQRLYATLPTADAAQPEPVTAEQAAKLGLVLAQAQEAVKDVEKAIAENRFDIAGTILEGIELAAETAGKAADKASKGALAALFAFVRSAWLTLTIVALVLALWFFWPALAARFRRGGVS